MIGQIPISSVNPDPEIQGVAFASVRMVPLNTLCDFRMPDERGVLFAGVCAGQLKWQIPELGLHLVGPHEWCMLGDLGPRSTPYVASDSCGCAVWLPLSFLSPSGSTDLPPKLQCLTCPVRNVSLFVKGACHGRLGWVISALMSEPEKGLSAAWMRQSLLAEWISLILDSDEIRMDRCCGSCWHEKDVCAIRSVASYLERYPGEAHSMAGLARAFHINECKLKKGFREHFGCSVFAYLRRIRMEQSMRMLRQNGQSVMEVALAVGYANPSHFARAFREVHGINPGQVLRPG